jgi:cobalt-zinc-cadmium efflux system protein
VVGVHDLHVWTIASGMHALSAHVVVLDVARNGEILAALRDTLHASVGIDHITIQIEPADYVERPLGF